MKTNHQSYDYQKSFNRIDEYLDAPSGSYDEKNEIPSRGDLTYSNGFYVECHAIFVDIRDSSELPHKYRRPHLARLYRAYISEIVAIMNSYEICKEINIVGDSVSGIFEASKKEHSKDAVNCAALVNSLVRALNYKLCKRGKDPIKIGIGIDQGRALMINAGNSGTGIKDIVWMGDTVNSASNLCGQANKDHIDVIAIGSKVYEKLAGAKNVYDEYYQSWFINNQSKDLYHANVINIEMNDWLEEKQNQSPCSM
ncbi:adenylate/guanylate cyclase domain-containing protein [Salicibibacter cibi]|uniref:Adenylate/guanylate cyclase domain-containing protein n=1 Tax=Salicibibacter cibi TaxID=2743001 RepID=A0A7T6ZCD5_9BACI|nr:adenylate/guanylate cyclase domain-containing protein [Salicibibacter cibi]QQK80441.1 adenylate/guanylate cyclase domain-containing protein [Salicibibacter cibi]